MKELFLNKFGIDSNSILSRKELKNIEGGRMMMSGPGLHKCCWEGTSNCSTCNEHHGCVSGAVLRDC